MGSFTTEYSNTILDQLAKTDAPYLALFTGSPGDAGAVTDEVTSSDYDRHDMADSNTKWDASAASRQLQNDEEVAFTEATETWGDVSHIALAAAATEGVEDLKMWGALTASKTIEANDQLVFAVGNITLSVAAG